MDIRSTGDNAELAEPDPVSKSDREATLGSTEDRALNTQLFKKRKGSELPFAGGDS